jgi:hypothetical protein
MILDDDSILSAYLDGELGPEQHQAVESAMAADPRLAEELRSLALLRDLLAGLPREAPADLTARVMRRVRHRARFGRAWGSVALGPVRAAGLAAIAAGVLMMLAIPWVLRRDGEGPAAGHTPDVVVQRKAPETPRRVLDTHRWPRFSSHPATQERATAPTASGGLRETEADRPAGDGSTPGELVHVREYLDNPKLRHVFLVSDLGDGSAEQRVATIVEETTRFNYYKFTIAQGMVIDPRHPDQATVFALAVGPNELDSLRDRLRMALKGQVQEQPAEAALVTQLADIGDVRACAPSPAADMEIPLDAHLAIKTPDAASDRPTPEQERSTPAAEDPARTRDSAHRAGPGHQPEAERRGSPDRAAPPEASDESLVVLVWVSRSRPG